MGAPAGFRQNRAKIPRKQTSAGVKKAPGDKAPSQKRVKEIQYSRITLVQLHFKTSDLKSDDNI